MQNENFLFLFLSFLSLNSWMNDIEWILLFTNDDRSLCGILLPLLACHLHLLFGEGFVLLNQTSRRNVFTYTLCSRYITTHLAIFKSINFHKFCIIDDCTLLISAVNCASSISILYLILCPLAAIQL
jgi:hypothetical protein